MASIVLLRGSLSGMGREAECGLVALRRIVSAPQKRRRKLPQVIYSDFGIIEAAEDLPDGSYTVLVGDHILSTDKKNGLWLSCRIEANEA